MDLSEDRPATLRGIGLAASVANEAIVRAAAETERLGYHSFWLNNPPGAGALGTLGVVARETKALRLGVGVIPLSHVSPQQIVADVGRNELPLGRFDLGVGSGAGTGGVQRVADALPLLRRELPCSLAVAALGPKMLDLAGSAADAVLLNWLMPEYARQSAARVRESAERAGRVVPRVLAYVRVSIGDAAGDRLRKEAAAYESYPAYAAHFRRMGVSAIDTALSVSMPHDLQRGLRAWEGAVDEVILRLITAHDYPDEILHLIEMGAPH